MTFASYIRRERIVRMRSFLARHVAVTMGNIHMKTSQEQK